MYLQELFDYKNQLMGDLLTSREIVKLVDDEVDPENAEQLAFTHIFPCEYIPETVENGYTYICFDVDIQSVGSKTYLMPTLYVWVMSHRSKLRLPEGGIRTDKLCSEICKKINGSRYYGLGQLNLYAVKRFVPLTDYQGKCMIFHATDFNRLYDPNRETPVNRRTG